MCLLPALVPHTPTTANLVGASFALSLQNSIQGAEQNYPIWGKGSRSLKQSTDPRDGSAVGQAAMSGAFVAGRGTSAKGKDQPLPASVWAITVSISENSKHRCFLGIKGNLAILTF